jgi:hypothetical protein
LSGASNAKAKRVLQWKPRRLEWLSFSPKENHSSRPLRDHSSNKQANTLVKFQIIGQVRSFS